MNLEKIVSLLGRSERDEEVKAMLSALEAKQPLRRPKRGDDTTYVTELPESEHYRMEFSFHTADSIESYSQEYLEGELIFHTVFVYPSEKGIADDVSFPLGISAQADCAGQVKRLGEPEDFDSDLMLYRWSLGGLKVFIQYKDEKTIKDISYGFSLLG